MNFTGGNTLPNIGKRINWQLATLLGGLAVAISAAALAGAFDRDSAPAQTAIAQPAAEQPSITPALVPSLQAPRNPEIVYLVVGSQEEARITEHALYEATVAMAGYTQSRGPQGVINVVVLDTPEKEAEFQAMIAMANQELMTVGASMSVVDLRAKGSIPRAVQGASTGTRPTVYIVESQADATALTSDLETLSLAVQGYDVPLPLTSIVVIDSPDDEHHYQAIFADQMALDSFDIIDLRR